MLIFLYGEDDYRRSRKLCEIVDNYAQKQSVFSVIFFDFSSGGGEFEKFKDYLAQQVIFSAKKLAVVKNISELSKELGKELAAVIKKTLASEEDIVIISDPQVPRAELEFLSGESAVSQRFDPLKGEKLKFYIRKEAENRGLELSDDAISFLSAVFEGDSWGLVTELEKLAFLDKKNLNAEDLEKASYYRISPNIFSFIDAVIKNKPIIQKLGHLESLAIGQEEYPAVFNILASRPYLGFDLIEKLADCDIAIKSGKLDYDLALLKIAVGS